MSEPLKIKFGNKTAWVVESTPELLAKNPKVPDLIYKDIRYLILLKKPLPLK